MKDTNTMVAALLNNAQEVARMEREFPGILEHAFVAVYTDDARLTWEKYYLTREERKAIAEKLKNRVTFKRKVDGNKIDWMGVDKANPHLHFKFGGMEDVPDTHPLNGSVVDLHPDSEDPDDASGFPKTPLVDLNQPCMETL